jgi:hypothetical protein
MKHPQDHRKSNPLTLLPPAFNAPGFFGLLRVQADSKPLATSDPVKVKRRLLKFLTSGRSDAVLHQQGTSTPLKILAPAEGNNKMAIQDDPGPFKLAASGKVEEYGPVLVIVPLEESVDFVIIELSPIDVCYREKL